MNNEEVILATECTENTEKKEEKDLKEKNEVSGKQEGVCNTHPTLSMLSIVPSYFRLLFQAILPLHGYYLCV
ncbi:MAG: hypothetical protein WC155_06790 [Candidatus Cloacimonadales bacterium]